jgi:hypothetical protein
MTSPSLVSVAEPPSVDDALDTDAEPAAAGAPATPLECAVDGPAVVPE